MMKVKAQLIPGVFEIPLPFAKQVNVHLFIHPNIYWQPKNQSIRGKEYFLKSSYSIPVFTTRRDGCPGERVPRQQLRLWGAHLYRQHRSVSAEFELLGGCGHLDFPTANMIRQQPFISTDLKRKKKKTHKQNSQEGRKVRGHAFTLPTKNGYLTEATRLLGVP